MVLRENSKKPQLSYWEHESKPHRCNHYQCEGVIRVSNIIHREKDFYLAHGYCEECGQKYLICEAPEWYNQQKEEIKPVMKRQVTERRLANWPELELKSIDQLARTIITATS